MLVGKDGGRESYVRCKKKGGEKIGMIWEMVDLREDSCEEHVLSELDRSNNDDSVT
ncbi:tetrahydrofolate dehydrogenase/cyclohydrolase catalytic domain-containing protein, partial [Staphylococcus warneri]|uniref:tetrahydrofolate dehydrogenase/cyclohydrolase catalytic domain-containing protein n=1 Tax=Staphylococcus warneri TaxID=1292 RepID=UPI003703B51E